MLSPHRLFPPPLSQLGVTAGSAPHYRIAHFDQAALGRTKVCRTCYTHGEVERRVARLVKSIKNHLGDLHESLDPP